MTSPHAGVRGRPSGRRILATRAGAAGLAVALAFVAVGGPVRALGSAAPGGGPGPARPVLAGDGPEVLRGIAGGLRLGAVPPADAMPGGDGCVRRQFLIGDGTYLNGRSRAVRWTPGSSGGLLVDRELMLRPAPTGARLQEVLREAAGSGWWRPSVEAFVPEWVAGTAAPSLSRDAGTAAGQLAAAAHREWPGRPSVEALVQTALDVAGVQYLDGWQRAALLEVLAAVPGVTLTGAGTDLAGRPGIAVRFVNSPDLLTVLVDRHSGEILASRTVHQDPVLGSWQLTILFLQRSRCAPPAWTGQTPWPAHAGALVCCGGAG